MTWSAKTDFEAVCKRAAGRRRYNAERRAKARERFKIVIDLTLPSAGRKRGLQAQLARALGVHRSTISRDVASWRRTLLEAARLWQEIQEREKDTSSDI